MSILKPVLLIADDDRDMRETLGQYFEDCGIQVQLVNDGQAAVEFVEENEVHVLLFDVHMPKLTGLEALFKIRKTNDRVPCILASAKLDSEIERLGNEGRAFAIFKKPEQLKDVRQSVFSALEQSYGWQRD